MITSGVTISCVPLSNASYKEEDQAGIEETLSSARLPLRVNFAERQAAFTFGSLKPRELNWRGSFKENER